MVKGDGGDIAGVGVAPGTAVGPGDDLTPLVPVESRQRVDGDGEQIAGPLFSGGAAGSIGTIERVSQGRCGQAAGVGGDFAPHGLFPPPFLPGKLKNAVDADPGNAGFPLGQPALLGRDKAAENAAFPGIDGVVPLVAVFAGRPGFRLGKGVGLVDAAIEGFAPVFGQGFQNGGRPVGVGKGLPIGTVPGDGAGGLDSGKAIAGAQQQEKDEAGKENLGHKGPPEKAPKKASQGRNRPGDSDPDFCIYSILWFGGLQGG